MNPGDQMLLRKIRVLRDAAPSVLNKFIAQGSVQNFARGSLLFEQGEHPRFAYLMLHGEVALVGKSGDLEMAVEFFGTGDIVLAAAVLLDRPYLVGARIIEESRIVMVPAQLFRDTVRADLSLAVAMAEEMAWHWRALVRQIKDLKLRSAPQRLAAYLLMRRRANATQLVLKADRKVLAGRLGMTPESLSRAFAALKELGVESKGHEVRIADAAKLSDYCAYEEAV